MYIRYPWPQKDGMRRGREKKKIEALPSRKVLSAPFTRNSAISRTQCPRGASARYIYHPLIASVTRAQRVTSRASFFFLCPSSYISTIIVHAAQAYTYMYFCVRESQTIRKGDSA